jgi:hypothetical protein
MLRSMQLSLTKDGSMPCSENFIPPQNTKFEHQRATMMARRSRNSQAAPVSSNRLAMTDPTTSCDTLRAPMYGWKTTNEMLAEARTDNG